MVKTLADLKKERTNRIQKIADEAKRASGVQFRDDRYWNPTVDKAGNGTAVIRFLDAPPGEDLPFVRKWTHNFKGPTRIDLQRGIPYNSWTG